MASAERVGSENSWIDTSDVGAVLGSLFGSMEHDCVEKYRVQLREAVDDDYITDNELIDVLYGRWEIEENADECDGVTPISKKISEIKSNFSSDESRLHNSKILVLSFPTTDRECVQRQKEIENFLSGNKIRDENTQSLEVSSLDLLPQIIEDYLKEHAEGTFGLSIIILGHGSIRTTVHEKYKSNGKAFQVGALALNHGHFKIHVDSEEIVRLVEERINPLTVEYNTPRKRDIHLCLFYCFAQVSTFEVKSNNLKVVLYRNGDCNPRSFITRTKDGKIVLDSRSKALEWFGQEMTKTEAMSSRTFTPIQAAEGHIVRGGPEVVEETQVVSTSTVSYGGIQSNSGTSQQSESVLSYNSASISTVVTEVAAKQKLDNNNVTSLVHTVEQTTESFEKVEVSRTCNDGLESSNGNYLSGAVQSDTNDLPESSNPPEPWWKWCWSVYYDYMIG